MRKELRFILRSMRFSICETLRKTRSNSFSFSNVVKRREAEPYGGVRKKKKKKINLLSMKGSFLMTFVGQIYVRQWENQH